MTRDRHSSLSGPPDNVILELLDWVETHLLADESVAAFFIGRAGISQLVARAASHHPAEILPLYQSPEPDYVIFVADALVREFIDREKCRNKEQEGIEDIATDDEYCVYVAVRWV